MLTVGPPDGPVWCVIAEWHHTAGVWTTRRRYFTARAARAAADGFRAGRPAEWLSPEEDRPERPPATRVTVLRGVIRWADEQRPQPDARDSLLTECPCCTAPPAVACTAWCQALEPRPGDPVVDGQTPLWDDDDDGAGTGGMILP